MDYGSMLIEGAFHQFLEETGYYFTDETENAACMDFLSAPVALRQSARAAT